MLEVGERGTCAYVENRICPKMSGVVILVLKEQPCFCSTSRGEGRLSDFFKLLCVFQAKKGIIGSNVRD